MNIAEESVKKVPHFQIERTTQSTLPRVLLNMRVLVIGCGYVGTPLATRLRSAGHEVWGVRRSPGDHSDLIQAGVTPLVTDITAEGALDACLDAGLSFDWVINATSSRGGGAEGYRQLYIRGTQRILDAFKNSPPQCYVHLSSTSVYAQTQGETVTEESPTEPLNETSRILVDTEQWLLGHLQDIRTVILRSAGIYGPERGHLFLKFLRGEATLTGDGSRWLNMVHRDDLVSAVIAALDHSARREVLNIADDEPVHERAFYEWLSLTLQRPFPPTAPPASGSRKRGDTNKRVSNAKLKSGWLPSLQFPDFRVGYLAEIQRLGC